MSPNENTPFFKNRFCSISYFFSKRNRFCATFSIKSSVFLFYPFNRTQTIEKASLSAFPNRFRSKNYCKRNRHIFAASHVAPCVTARLFRRKNYGLFVPLPPEVFSTRRMVFNTSVIRIGFDKCSFMPASRILRTSSSNAFAVIATMGIVFASG